MPCDKCKSETTYTSACNLHGRFGDNLCQACALEHNNICESLGEIPMETWWLAQAEANLIDPKNPRRE